MTRPRPWVGKPAKPQAQKYVVISPDQTLWSGRRLRLEQAVRQMNRLNRSSNCKGEFTIGEVKS